MTALVSVIVAHLALAAQTALIPPTHLFTAPKAGFYRISCELETSDTNTTHGTDLIVMGSAGDLGYPAGVCQENVYVNPPSAGNNNVGGGEGSDIAVVRLSAGATISYETVATQNQAAPALPYNIYIVVENIQ